jgi:transposase-like protein
MRKKYSAEEKARLVREWDQSGLTAAEFARPRGIADETLRVWGRQVRGALQRRSRSRPVARSLEVIELGTGSKPEPLNVEIVLRNGLRLALVGDLVPAQLAAIVRALEKI